ncbi:MAG: SpaA isopeptide-forming pilin-related protein, partial [Eubacteriales bacterium]|nr:SpaA isopeptide-forming pilin-related protein [Eubacteriales bacterium]
ENGSGEKGKDGDRGAESGTESSPGKDAEGTAEGTAEAAADAGEAAEEEWMTDEEFSRAFASVTGGARKGAASTLSQATIISKSAEIDYEELGIGEDVHGHHGHTTPVNIRDEDSNEYVGICVSPDDRGWAKGSVLPGVTRVMDAVMIKLYYYTMLDDYGEELARSRGFGENSREVAIAACHEAMSMRFSELGGVEYDRPNVGSNLRALINAYREGVAGKPALDPDKVIVYISARVQKDGHWIQPYVFGRMEEEESSSVVLIKASSDPDMRSGYSAYCLHETASGGTVNFRMYTDQACTSRAQVWSDAEMTQELDPIPIGLTSKSGLNNRTVFYCAPGTYYLKEVSTPKGYQTQSEPFGPYVLQEGKGKTIKVTNTPRYAKVGIIKKDAETGKVLTGAKFGLYTSAEDARNEENPEGFLTTGSDGKSNLLDVLAGKTYYVREISAPAGYSLAAGIKKLTAAESVTQTVWTEITNQKQKGTVSLKKVPQDPAANRDPYSLKGAVYKLYDESGAEAGTLTTGADGTSNTLTVPCGSYTIREVTASPGFLIDTKTYNVKVTADSLSTVESVEKPETGKVRVKKQSKDPKADGSPYSLAGAVYKIYDSTGAEAGTLTTGADGTSNTLTVLCGSYTVKETTASPGFLIDTKTYNVKVTADTVSTVDSVETPKTGKVRVRKQSEDPKADSSPYSLAGAVYKLYDSAGAEAGTLTTGADGTSNTLTVLCGSYTVKETAASPGFLIDTKTYNVKVTADTVATVDSVETPKTGKVRVRKQSENPKADSSPYSLAGAVYKLYDRNGEEAGTLTTGTDGVSNTLTVLCGDYTVKETTASPCFLIDSKTYTVKVTADNLSTVESVEKPKTGKVRVCKRSEDPEADSTPYSLAGAVYKLYDKSGEEAGTLTTGTDGTSNTLTVLCGNYTLKETTPSPGFLIDTKTYNVNVAADTLSTAESVEKPRKGKITVFKSSSEEPEGKEQDTMPIAGAQYGLYKTRDDAAEGKAAAGTFIIKEDGSSNIIEMLAGKTYFVKETKTPEGYLPDEEIHEFRLESLTETLTVKSVDRLIFGGVKIGKIDYETKKGTALGGASLEGAIFRIYNDGDLSIYADGKKVLPGAPAMTVVTDKNGIAETKADALSYGSYRVEEITPPEGYLLKESQPVRFSVREDHKTVDLTGSTETSIANRIMRGDFSIRKIDGYTQNRMAGVTFEISGLDKEGNTLETHRFTTDRNGSFESTAAWAAMQKEETGRLWFGIGTEPEDSLGALPYGDYHIEEIEGENNRGMKMYSGDISIYADNQQISLGNVENTLKPVLETELVDEEGDHFISREGMVTLIDTVTYAGMETYIGKEVTFHGVIYVRETGEPLRIGNRTVEAVKTRKILSPSGTVQLRFTFDASRAPAGTLVCYEYVSESSSPETAPESQGGNGQDENGGNGNTRDENGENAAGETGDTPKLIAEHADPDDEAQSVDIVTIETQVEDLLSGMRIGNARDGAVTVDHVTCDGLRPGTEYLVTGFLVDKSTGRPLKDRDGREITASASFRAEKASETVNLTFTYDASLLEGTTAVAFERLYLAGDGEPGQPDTPDTPDTPDQPDTPD